MKGKQKIVCDNCGRLSDYQKSVKSRPVKGLPELEEIGLECSHCKTWAHSQFDGPQPESFRVALKESTDRLEGLRGSLNPRAVDKALKDYHRAKRRVAAEHKRFNEIYRKKLDVITPSEAKTR